MKTSRGAEILFEEIIADNFPTMGKYTDIQVQKAQIVPKKRNPRKPTPRHTITQMSKVKNKGN